MDDVEQSDRNDLNRFDRFIASRSKVLSEVLRLGKTAPRTQPKKYVLDFAVPVTTDAGVDNEFSQSRSFVVDRDCKKFELHYIGMTTMVQGTFGGVTPGLVSIPFLVGNPVQEDVHVRFRDSGSNRMWQSDPLPLSLLNSKAFEANLAALSVLRPGTQVFADLQGLADFATTIACNVIPTITDITQYRFIFEFVGVQHP